MKFNQLVDDAAEKYEVPQAANFADLARPAQLQAKNGTHSYRADTKITLINSILTAKNLHFVA